MQWDIVVNPADESYRLFKVSEALIKYGELPPPPPPGNHAMAFMGVSPQASVAVIIAVPISFT